MSTETNKLKKESIWKSLFGNNDSFEEIVTLDDIGDNKLEKTLKNVLLSRKKQEQEVEKYINQINGIKEEVSDVKNILHSSSHEAMRKIHRKIKEEQERKEKEEDDKDYTR